MKKFRFISVCLIMLMLLSLSYNCFAATEEGYLFEDDFDGYSIGDLPYGASQKWSDFSDRGFSQWTPSVVQDPTDSANQVMAIDKNTVAESSTKYQHLKTVQETINGQIEASFKFYIPSDVKITDEKTYNSTSSDSYEIEIAIVDSELATSFFNSAKINPNKGTIVSLGKGIVLNKDNWYTVRMTANTESGTVETYLGDNKINTEEKESIIGKYTNELRFIVTGKLPESLIYVDDVKVEKKVKPWNYKVNQAYYADETAFISAPTAGKMFKEISLSKSALPSGNNLLVAAYYNSQGNMKAVKSVNLSASNFDADGNAKITVDMKFPDLASDVAGGALKVFMWDAMGNMVPLTEPYVTNDAVNVPTLYLVGDSTMAEYKETSFPRAGIGQMLESYVNGIDVVNYGSSGKDTADYLTYSGWTNILQNAKMGDYVLIQLGINDRIHDIGTDESLKNLTTMTDTLLEKGINVILNTPTIRRIFDDSGKFRATFDENGKFITTDTFTSDKGDYLAAINSFIAQRKGTQGFFSVDMTAVTAEMIGENAIFEDRSRRYYMQDVYYNWDSVYAQDERATGSVYANKEGDSYKFCASDYTHLTMYGADVIAQKLVKEIEEMNIPLSNYIVNTTKEITYPNFDYTYPQ